MGSKPTAGVLFRYCYRHVFDSSYSYDSSPTTMLEVYIVVRLIFMAPMWGVGGWDIERDMREGSIEEPHDTTVLYSSYRYGHKLGTVRFDCDLQI